MVWATQCQWHGLAREIEVECMHQVFFFLLTRKVIESPQKSCTTYTCQEVAEVPIVYENGRGRFCGYSEPQRLAQRE